MRICGEDADRRWATGDNGSVEALIDVRLLGRFCVLRGNDEVRPSAFGGRQSRQLLRMLAIRRGQFVSNDVLAEAIWPGALPANPATALNVLVHRARRALGDTALIVTGAAGYSLTETGRCRVDSEVFLANVAAGADRLAGGQVGAALACFQVALDGWGGEPLAEDAYEDWAQPFRTRLDQAHTEALEGAARAALALGSIDEAARWAEEAISSRPLREAPYVVLARALARSGDFASAVAALDRLRHRVASELGAEPSAEISLLRAQLSGNGPPERAAAVPARRTAGGGDLVGARAKLRDSILRQGPRAERSIQLARMALLVESDRGDGACGDGARGDGADEARHLVELALIEAGGDVLARAHALATGAILDGAQGRLCEAEGRWADVGRLFESIGASGLTALFRDRAVHDGREMLEHLAELFGGWCQIVVGGPAPFDRGLGLVSAGMAAEGLAEIDAALAIASQLGDESARAAGEWYRSEALLALGNDDEARSSARSALEASVRLADDRHTAESLYALGVAAEAGGEGTIGLAFLFAALERTSGVSVSILSSRILVRLAAALLASSDPDGADAYLARALFETRLLRAELALSIGDADADTLVAAAIAVAPATPAPADQTGWSALTAFAFEHSCEIDDKALEERYPAELLFELKRRQLEECDATDPSVAFD